MCNPRPEHAIHTLLHSQDQRSFLRCCGCPWSHGYHSWFAVASSLEGPLRRKKHTNSDWVYTCSYGLNGVHLTHTTTSHTHAFGLAVFTHNTSTHTRIFYTFWVPVFVGVPPDARTDGGGGWEISFFVIGLMCFWMLIFYAALWAATSWRCHHGHVPAQLSGDAESSALELSSHCLASRSPRSPPWFLIDFSEKMFKMDHGKSLVRNRSNSSKFTQNEPDGKICVITWPGMTPEKATRIATKCLNLTEKIRRFLPHVRETRMGANGSRNPKHLKSHSSCLSNRDFDWQTVCVLGLNRPGRPPGKKNSVKPNVERLESRHRDAKRRLRITSPPQATEKNEALWLLCRVRCVCVFCGRTMLF